MTGPHFPRLLISPGEKQCCGSWIRDPMPFWPLDAGSGWVKIRIQIRDKLPGSYFRELKNHFFDLKYLNSLMRLRDPGWKKFGSGIDLHPGSATLVKIHLFRWSLFVLPSEYVLYRYLWKGKLEQVTRGMLICRETGVGKVRERGRCVHNPSSKSA